MTCDRRPEFLSFIGKAQEIYEQEGLLYFWSGIGALLFRELPFAIAKVRSKLAAFPGKMGLLARRHKALVCYGGMLPCFVCV